MKQQKGRPRPRIGPGTLAMFIGIGVFALYSYMTQPASPDRVYYESNAKGELVRADRPAVSSHKLPTLLKPEPQWIIDLVAELGMSKAQKERVAKVQVEWSRTKAGFDARFKPFSTLVSERAKSSGTSTELQQALAEYSTLSREFDRQRQDAWNRSTEQLSREQRQRLQTLLEANR